MLKNIRSYFMKYKKYQQPLEIYIFPLVLLFYPLIGVNQGVDIADTTYSLVNYEYMLQIDPMWILSTFVSNITGRILMSLPFGDTMLGISVYCTMFISATALVSYYALQEYMPGWMIFIGLFISESLCWCPRVILYNYLSYMFLTFGTLMLLKGLFSWKKQSRYLFAAGILLGVNVMVRFPNIVEAALILVVWFYGFITKEEVLLSLKRTGVCVLGYLVGFGFFYLISCVMYDPGAYFDMLSSLFGMTKGASDYSSGGMMSMILGAYGSVLSKMVIMVPCVLAGIVMFSLWRGKYLMLKKCLYVMGLLILVRYFFSVGTLTRNYTYYDSVFNIAMVLVVIAAVVGIIGALGVLNGSRQEQTLAFTVVLLILLLPLGSNNYTYPILNCLFIIVPITLWLIRRLMQRLGENDIHFSWQAMITMVIIATLVQGCIFHYKFAFGDGMDGEARDSSSDKIARISGMNTTEYNLESLEEVYNFLETDGALDKKAVFFGGVPGLSYIFGMEPAINTAWPDLDSYSTLKFGNEIVNISVSEEPKPLVIVGKDLADYNNILTKYDILLDYINVHDYNKVFENERFVIFESEE